MNARTGLFCIHLADKQEKLTVGVEIYLFILYLLSIAINNLLGYNKDTLNH